MSNCLLGTPWSAAAPHGASVVLGGGHGRSDPAPPEDRWPPPALSSPQRLLLACPASQNIPVFCYLSGLIFLRGTSQLFVAFTSLLSVFPSGM